MLSYVWKDKTVFALLKAYEITCILIMYRAKGNKEHGRKFDDSWGNVLVQDFILLNPHNFSCKVGDSVVSTLKSA